mgnify:CR=1 FL=1
MSIQPTQTQEINLINDGAEIEIDDDEEITILEEKSTINSTAADPEASAIVPWS